MKKTIAKLIELGFIVSRIKGYKIFTTNYIHITHKDKTIIASLDDERQMITLVKSKNGKLFYYGVFGQYLNSEDDKLFKKSLRKVIYTVGQPLNHPDNSLPEKYRGEKEVDTVDENSKQAETDFLNMLMDLIGKPQQNKIEKQALPIQDEFQEMVKDLKARNCLCSKKRIGGPRKFNLSIFIKNVLTEVFNVDKEPITFDITEFNTVVFSRYAINLNPEFPYLWRVTVDLSSLDNDKIPFIANIDIMDSDINVKNIFNSEYDLAEFINFYKKFKKGCVK